MSTLLYSTFDRKLSLRIGGGSHENHLHCEVKNFPISCGGEEFDLKMLQEFLAIRSPGRMLTSPRKENDMPIFEEDTFDGNVLKKSDFSFYIKNEDAIKEPYKNIMNKPRPGHADFPARVKYGENARLSGGGIFSGRMTAPLCVVGGLAMQLLKKENITVFSHILSIGEACDISFDNLDLNPHPIYKDACAGITSIDSEILDSRSQMPVFDKAAADKMMGIVAEVAEQGDSIGGIVECIVLNLPVGIGGAMFDGLESVISEVLFAIPGVKGVEFGAGFNITKMLGSQANDPYYFCDDLIKTYTNNHGGILGGMSTGMPLIVRAAFKPTSSIGIPQNTINLKTNRNDRIKISGRHDPCIVLRAHPIVSAAVAIAILDSLL